MSEYKDMSFLGFSDQAVRIILRTSGIVGAFILLGIISAFVVDIVPTVAISSFPVFWGAVCAVLVVVIFVSFIIFPIIFIIDGVSRWEDYQKSMKNEKRKESDVNRMRRRPPNSFGAEKLPR